MSTEATPTVTTTAPTPSPQAKAFFDAHRVIPRAPKPPVTLPAGLVHHCDSCKIVIPSDAPTPEGGNCAFVAQHKLAWFNPAETIAAQHVMAVNAWALIHHIPLTIEEPTSTAYRTTYQRSRKAHFAASAARSAMTQEQVQDGARHRRDGALYK